MIRFILLVLLTAVAFLIEPIVGSELANTAVRPDVLLVPLIVAVLACPGPWAVVWGGLIGLGCDCLAGPTLGPQIALLSLLAAMGSLASRPTSMAGVFVLSFGLTASAQAALLALRQMLDGGPLIAMPAAVQIAGGSAATAFLILGLWLSARQSSKLFGLRPPDGERIVSIGWQRSAD